MKNLVTIGLPSKGRLKEGSIGFLEKKILNLLQTEGKEIILPKLKIFRILKLFICTQRRLYRDLVMAL